MAERAQAVMQPPRTEERRALVLGGGGALGAYEVGVIGYALDHFASEDNDLGLEILSGTSAGAINTGFLASHADDPPAYRARRLAELWGSLRLSAAVRPSAVELLGMFLDGRVRRIPRLSGAFRGGLLDPRPIARLLRREAVLSRIDHHLRTGRLHGVLVSTTHVPSGRCVTFVQTRHLPPRPLDPWTSVVPAELQLEHLLASAAIPLLFPPVVIDGEPYCDGGMRQMVPLSPALWLGATSILVVDPVAPVESVVEPPPAREALTSPVYLAGKAINALFLDRLEIDLARLAQVNAILAAGTDRWGPGFAHELNQALAWYGWPPLAEVRALRVRPSRDLGRMAADFIARPSFVRRERGLAGMLLRILGRTDPARAGDLLAYLLFDGEFEQELIALGRDDARARHHALARFFSGAPVAAGAAS